MKGWFKQSRRHSLARKRIKTGRKHYVKVPMNITKKQWLKGDFDKDKVPNYKDCRPLDPKRHMVWDVEGAKAEGYKIDYMTPEEYIRKTGLDPKDKEYFKKYYDVEEEKEKDLSELSKLIDDPNKKVAVPWVGDEGYLTGVPHEGRHRAKAAEKAGHELIPVAVNIPERDRARLGEEFIEKAFPDSDEGYKEEWRQRFKRGNPMAAMSSTSRKIYLDIINEDVYNKENRRAKEILQEVKKKYG